MKVTLASKAAVQAWRELDSFKICFFAKGIMCSGCSLAITSSWKPPLTQ